MDNGIYTVTLTVNDDDGGVGVDTLTVTVNNVAPTVDAGSDQTVDEGDVVSFSGSFTDPGSADTYVIDWDFGDGLTDSGTLTQSHVYTNDGIYTATLTITDDDGSSTSDTLTVTVNNVAPMLLIVEFIDGTTYKSFDEGDRPYLTLTGDWTDPGADDYG